MMHKPMTALAGQSLEQRHIDLAATLHERFLRGRGGRRAVLRFVEARGLDCRRRLLNDSDFTGASMEGALLAGSHLERASFYCANLQGCDLRATNLKRADLRGARLAGSALNGSVMDGADMRAASLLYANSDAVLHVVGADQHEITKRGAAGFGADFTNCAMRGVRLCAANLKGANFTGALIESADFSGAKLTDAIFRGTVLTSAVLDRESLSPEQLSGCVPEPDAEAIARVPAILAKLSSAASWVESGGKVGEAVIVDHEDLRPMATAFRGRLLTALSARGARAIGLDCSGSELQGANFDGADLRSAIFDRADLRGASFRNAQLSHATFVGANLAPLTLLNGHALAVDFSGAAMERVDLMNTVRADASF